VAVYSIKDLEQISGIKAHTIRIWEKRYGIVEPKRTATNIRFYEDEDLLIILNVAILNRNGIRISKIATMKSSEMAEKVAKFSDMAPMDENQLDVLTLSIIGLDEYKFKKILSSNIKQIGFENTMLEIIYPMTEKLSYMWMAGSIKPVHENFMNLELRQLMISAIDSLAIPCGQTKSKKYLFFLPTSDTQDLSILFLHYLILKRGNRVLNLGSGVSMADLKDACEIYQPDVIFSLINAPIGNISIREYVSELFKLFPELDILLTGYQVVADSFIPPHNVHIAKGLKDVVSFVEEYNEENC